MFGFFIFLLWPNWLQKFFGLRFLCLLFGVWLRFDIALFFGYCPHLVFFINNFIYRWQLIYHTKKCFLLFLSNPNLVPSKNTTENIALSQPFPLRLFYIGDPIQDEHFFPSGIDLASHTKKNSFSMKPTSFQASVRKTLLYLLFKLLASIVLCQGLESTRLKDYIHPMLWR